MFLQLMDGEAGLGVVFAHWNQLARCDEILSWLLKNSIKGRNLSQMIQEQFKGNPFLGSAKWILKKIDLDVTTRPILAGRDYKI